MMGAGNEFFHFKWYIPKYIRKIVLIESISHNRNHLENIAAFEAALLIKSLNRTTDHIYLDKFFKRIFDSCEIAMLSVEMLDVINVAAECVNLFKTF